MFKILEKIEKFLKLVERNYLKTFWVYILIAALLFNQSVKTVNPYQDDFNLNDIILLTAVNSNSKESRNGNFVLQTFLGRKKKFDIVFHRRLEKHFPDWEARVNYQQRQEKFYRSAIIKKKELSRFHKNNDNSFFTKEELDAIDYFDGRGFYKKYQNPKMKPNVFDTRQTFLFKMHNSSVRNNFLNSFNSKKS